MGKCAICRNLTDGNICTICGYDVSLNYERFGSLTDFCAEVKSEGMRQRIWTQINGKLLRCNSCGGTNLAFEEETLTHYCRKCWTIVDSPKILSLLEKTKNCASALSVKSCSDSNSILEKRVIQTEEVHMPNLEVDLGEKLQQDTLPEEKRLIFLSGSKKHSVGLWSDGTSFAMGYDGYGQCKIAGWKNIRNILALPLHTIALCEDGHVLATGYNWYGQCNVSHLSNVVAIAGSDRHTVALHADGKVSTAGVNGYGQCDVSKWTNVIAVAAGSRHTLGLRKDGTVLSAGKGECTGTAEWKNIIAIGAGNHHSVGLDSKGHIWVAGSNGVGQCNTKTWAHVKMVAVGALHTVGLLESGTVLAVGENADGRCNVQAWKDIAFVFAGSTYTFGVKKDGGICIAGYLPEADRVLKVADNIDIQSDLARTKLYHDSFIQSESNDRSKQKRWKLW